MNEICFKIPECTDNLLLACIFLLAAGLVIFSAMMGAVIPFMMDANLKKISVLKLEWPQPYAKLTLFLDGLPEKTKDMIKLNLKLDFCWMAFLYLLMICLGSYIWRHSDSCDLLQHIVCYLPLANWIFDIMENVMTFEVLKDSSPAKARIMGTFSVLKWSAGAVYLLCLLYLLALVIMTHSHCHG
jgi:hypothetical protein